jgi:hypothetical protein
MGFLKTLYEKLVGKRIEIVDMGKINYTITGIEKGNVIFPSFKGLDPTKAYRFEIIEHIFLLEEPYLSIFD